MEEIETQESINFINLPDHIQANVMTYCDFKTMINVSETCKHLNQLLFSEPKLNKRVRFVVPILETNFFTTVQVNDRRYKNVKIQDEVDFDFDLEVDFDLLKMFEVKGEFFEDLIIRRKSVNIPKLLGFCNGLVSLQCYWCDDDRESYYVDALVSNLPRFQLPKLKDLLLDAYSLWIIELFKNVKQLENFQMINIRGYETVGGDILDFLEDFILQQNGLKFLRMNIDLIRGLFSEDKLGKMKFQLESFSITESTIDEVSAPTFLEKQRSSLKKVEIKFSSQRSFINVLKEIVILPKLKTLTLESFILDSSVVELKGISNLAVNHLQVENIFNLNQLLSIFPRLHEVVVGKSFSFTRFSAPSRKLDIIKCLAETVYYSLDEIEEQDQLEDETEEAVSPPVMALVEERLLKFLARHKHIHNFLVSAKNQSGTLTLYPLSRNFWKAALELIPNLKNHETCRKFFIGNYMYCK